MLRHHDGCQILTNAEQGVVELLSHEEDLTGRPNNNNKDVLVASKAPP